jgi:hypothetical protein
MYQHTRKYLLLLLCFISFVQAKTFDMLTNTFSLSTPDTSQLQSNYLNYGIEHQELLRESKNDTLLSRYTLREQHVELNYTFKKFSIYTSWSRNILSMSDAFNTDYTSTNPRPISNGFNLKAQTKINNWLLQPGIHYAFSSLSDTLFINEYPVSETIAYNNYLFNLLPETFGDTIPYQNSFNNYYVELLASDQRLLFYLKYTNTINRLTESHINTSSNDKLNGPRETLCKLNYSHIRAIAGWHATRNSYVWMGLNYSFSPLNWDHTILPDTPVASEIDTIAKSNTQSFNAQLAYQLLRFPVNFQAILSSGNVRNTSMARTPVLGYVLGILPVSHRADIDLRSSYILTHLHFDYPLKTGNSVFTPYVDMIASRFWSDISLLALLQFGLEDIDYQEHYIHAAYIATIGCKAKIALNQDLFLTFNVDQLLPYIKTISPEPPTPIPSDIKRYGGLSISAGVSMSW